MVKPEGKSSGSRWENNIKIDLKERRWEGADLIQVAQDREH
jgi:hypothetical protein